MPMQLVVAAVGMVLGVMLSFVWSYVCGRAPGCYESGLAWSIALAVCVVDMA